MTTTVADLVERWLTGPKLIRGKSVSTKTAQDYRYASQYVLNSPMAAKLPRYVTVQDVKDFLADVANTHGQGSAKHVRAVLSHALDIAVASSGKSGPDDMHTPINPTLGAKSAIPDVVNRTSTLDHQRTTSTTEAATLLWRLYHDPEALPMGARRRSGKGEHAVVPNSKDVADLVAWLFSTGSRLGEALGLRYSDLRGLGTDSPSAEISGTVTYTVGQGVRRQSSTKTNAGRRSVPLHPRTVAMLRRRAEVAGLDLSTPPAVPVFGSPQFPDRYRDPSNLNTAVRRLFDRYGVTFGRSHL